MVIILFFLLVAVWAAVLLPSVMNARRETLVNSTRTPEPPAVRPYSAGGPSADTRRKVLARRRYALIALAVGAVLTLAGAIVTGSFPLLIATLVLDVLLAAYIGVLLQVKQRKHGGYEASGYDEGDIPVRIAGG